MLRKKFSEVVVFMVVYHGIESVKKITKKTNPSLGIWTDFVGILA